KPQAKPEPEEAKSEEEPLAPRPAHVRPSQDKPRSERLHEEMKAEQKLPVEQKRAAPKPETSKTQPQRAEQALGAPGRQEEIVPMSKLRRTVAERLVEAQRNSALLTTFNEVDMSSVMALRKEHGEAFQKKYNVKLGFMSFFVKATIDALKQFPA